jgi:hypothetical protein
VDGYTEPLDGFNYRPAVVATGAWIGIGLALDAYLLVKRKDRLISDVLRTKPGRAFLVVFVLHIVNVLGRVDPFSAAASVINGRLAKVAPALSDVLLDQ